MIFKSHIATEISGSVGGTTYSHNNGGMYMRARAVPIHSTTKHQAAARTALTQAVTLWTERLNADQRAAWDQYAANVPMPGPLGNSRQITGQTHYVRCIVPEIMASQLFGPYSTFLRGGPGVYDLGHARQNTIDAYNTSDGLIFNIDTTAPWATDTGGRLFVYQRKPANESRWRNPPSSTTGIGNPHTTWRMIMRIIGTDGPPLDNEQNVSVADLNTFGWGVNDSLISQFAWQQLEPDNRLTNHTLSPATTPF